MYCLYQPSTEYEYDFDGRLKNTKTVFNQLCTGTRCAAWNMYRGKCKYNNNYEGNNK